MTTTSQTFVSCIPSTEEEMLEICNELVHQHDGSAEKFFTAIEHISELLGVMEDFFERQNRRKEAGK